METETRDRLAHFFCDSTWGAPMQERRMWAGWSRKPVAVQGKLAFAVRAEKRVRAFKRAIGALTALAILALVAGTETGRYAAVLLAHGGRTLINRLVGL